MTSLRVNLLTSIVFFLGGNKAMADQIQDYRPPLMFVDYEGFADLGRIKVRIGRTMADAEYSNHPMVLAKEKPWKKKVSLSFEQVKRLFSLLQTDEVKKTKCKLPDLMPGQDVSLKSISAAIGKSPPFFRCEFIETPETLKDILKEIEDIYLLVKRTDEDHKE